ncbi:hypothetical protein AX17_001436 [Amanita inopinata Kibby_2008]|nr:hypothetical protein AX17_001436 [Amanita inopinata Kibby_2008]
MSLLLTIFVLTFMTQLISWIGQAVIQEMVYNTYLRLVNSDLAIRQRNLKAEILTARSELMKTSAQDHFAKWAKLRRKVDKGLSELEKLNSEIATGRTAFSVKFSSVIWILTTGLQFLVGWWYRKAAVFYLPEGLFGPLTWWMAFPFAPKGSVSVGVWQMACRRVLLIGERVIKDFAGSHSSEAEEEVPVASEEKPKTS